MGSLMRGLTRSLTQANDAHLLHLTLWVFTILRALEVIKLLKCKAMLHQ